MTMEEPANTKENTRPNIPAPPGRMQVKSQNPISNSQDPRASRAPSPAPAINAVSPAPLGRTGPHAPSPASTKQQQQLPKKSPPESPGRLRGGSPDVKAKALKVPHQFHPSPPPVRFPPPVRSPTPVRSSKTPMFVPEGVVTPVFPDSPADMVGAHLEKDTGLTNPYNMWGAVNKYGHLGDKPPFLAQKNHYEGKHDRLSKHRLQRRKFCHIRHAAYKELLEPEDKTCPAYLDPKRKEFWRTDVERVLKREMNVEKERQKGYFQHRQCEEAFRRSELERDREDRWKAFLEYDKNVKYWPGFRNNKSGVKYDIFTHQPTDEYEAKKVAAEQMRARYMLVKRGLYIQERMSGARPYDILSWRVLPKQRELPEWPGDIGPPPPSRHPDPRVALNASKGPISFALPIGPFGTYANGIR